jgi:hypothetical protein
VNYRGPGRRVAQPGWMFPAWDIGSSSTSYSNATPSGSCFGKPCIGSVAVRKDLEVITVADLLAGIDVNPDRFHLTIL